MLNELKFKGVKYDSCNCRLYVECEEGIFVLININSMSRPIWMPHSYTSDGEPCSPIKDGTEWVLCSIPEGAEQEFSVGMAHTFASIDEFGQIWRSKAGVEPQYSQFKDFDRSDFMIKFGQQKDLPKAMEQFVIIKAV